MPDNPPELPKPTVSLDYGLKQILAAYSTAESHQDAETRDRALAKIRKWNSVLMGMFSGHLQIGNRAPVSDLPAWVTLEVVTGGFATGRPPAGGKLLPHECELGTKLGLEPKTTDRAALNAYHLSDGFPDLVARLESGDYAVEVPEEGALLVVAWLLTNGHEQEAIRILDTIAPWFSKLRFFPRAGRFASSGSGVSISTAGESLQAIRKIVPNPRILTHRKAVHVWGPLYRRMTALFFETVRGETPTIQPLDDGSWTCPATGRFQITGGWPCQNYPADWRTRAAELLADVKTARAEHKHCTAHSKEGGSFASIHKYLERCEEDPSGLTGRDVGRIRLILARHHARTADATATNTLHERQAAETAGPLHSDIASVVARRLEAYNPDQGVTNLDPIIAPVTKTEAVESGLPDGIPIPASVARKASRCLAASPGRLVSMGIVKSGESLARVIPLLAAGICSADFEDPKLRHLFGTIYQSFSRRRSLLLLNLEKQVGLDELPWIAALRPFRRGSAATIEAARGTLKELVALTLRSFPHAIIPNKLLREFVTLSKAAGLELPLVEELAADIFMGAFSQKHVDAAKQASGFMRDSLYAKYYRINHEIFSLLPDTNDASKPGSGTRDTARPDPLVLLCAERAGLQPQRIGSVVHNGMIIEQAQILTTHNLAIFFREFDLGKELRSELRDMACQCLRWILAKQKTNHSSRHRELIVRKNTAYAWRQLVFYISFLPSPDANEFLLSMHRLVDGSGANIPESLIQAVRGLGLAFHGDTTNTDIPPFVGWTKSPPLT